MMSWSPPPFPLTRENEEVTRDRLGDRRSVPMLRLYPEASPSEPQSSHLRKEYILTADMG